MDDYSEPGRIRVAVGLAPGGGSGLAGSPQPLPATHQFCRDDHGRPAGRALLSDRRRQGRRGGAGVPAPGGVLAGDLHLAGARVYSSQPVILQTL